MREEYYQIAPQMRDYHAARHVFAPYVMQINAPNYRSSYFSTDEFGFRTTIYQGEPLELQQYHDSALNGHRAALVGDSTSFGAGATSDASTIPSLLNRTTPWVWFNFSGRTYHSTQELIMFILFAPRKVEQVVILSGINNFDMSYRWFNVASTYLPPFYSQAIYLAALDFYFNSPSLPLLGKDLWSVAKRALKRILRRKAGPVHSTNVFFPDFIRERFFSHTRELECLLQDPGCITRSLWRFERDIQLWSALVGQNRGAVTFILQPVPEWTCKVPSPEEKKLFEYVREQRGEAWEKVSTFLKDEGDSYRSGVKRICERSGVRFFDANEFPFLKDDQWTFLDRYHLTDRGQALIAHFIADHVIS